VSLFLPTKLSVIAAFERVFAEAVLVVPLSVGG
jgi:hypothetical protein